MKVGKGDGTKVTRGRAQGSPGILIGEIGSVEEQQQGVATVSLEGVKGGARGRKLNRNLVLVTLVANSRIPEAGVGPGSWCWRFDLRGGGKSNVAEAEAATFRTKRRRDTGPP